MKRALLLSLLFLLPLLLLALPPTYANATNAYDKTSASNPTNMYVEHVVQIRDGGLVFINDTIRLSTKPGEKVKPLNNFLLGFPFKYGSHLDYCFAYDNSNPHVGFDVVRDVGLGRIGFYGINVTFPKPIDISDGKSYNFTVVSVFSNLITSTAENTFTVDIPLQPGLTQNASQCDIRINLPRDADYVNSSFNYYYYQQVLSHTVIPLRDFTHEPGWLTFESEVRFLLIDVDEVRRQIVLDQWGHILLSDFYTITNRSEKELPRIDIPLPRGAHSVSAQDAIGDLSVFVEKGNETTSTNATITFRTELKKSEKQKFTVSYEVLRSSYVNQLDWRYFNLTLNFPERFKWVVGRSTVTITLPEGAEYVRVEPSSAQRALSNLEKSVFKQRVTLIFHNTTPFQNLSFTFLYVHPVFWASFRPTLWIGTLAVIISFIAFLWRAPKPPVPVIPIPLKDLKSFVDQYEEKTSILSELESLEGQARKGKIPRRRYKMRKKTLEGRLSILSRNLTALREKIRKAGPRYASITKKIEVAETELEGAETDIRRIRLRYRRGEISASAYRKLLEDSDRRRDRAKTAIDEVLLRLEEEIR